MKDQPKQEELQRSIKKLDHFSDGRIIISEQYLVSIINSQVLQALDKVKKHGVEHIVISGEPLRDTPSLNNRSNVLIPLSAIQQIEKEYKV